MNNKDAQFTFSALEIVQEVGTKLNMIHKNAPMIII